LPESSSASSVATSTAGSCAASVAERAAYVIAHGAISLDAKLGIFTVRGTVEPRVVQLFPKLSCSCTAGGGCYHIAAVKQAIGRTLNLTQLRKNKCNRPDKTSGRKRPRIADVDVIAAPDADPTVASAATGHVDASREIEPLASTYAAHSATDMEPDDDAEDAWLQCDKRPCWYHVVCIGVRNTAAAYTCDMCII